MSAEQLESATRLLEPLLDDLVFVGGAVVPLLLTDPAAQRPRVTKDVDAIDTRAVSVALTYARAGELRGLGFDEAQEMIGRWRHSATGVLVDVMPPHPTPLAPSNRWYPRAVEHATWHILPSGRRIRLIDPVSFIATKLVAHAARGARDALASHDLEDVLTIIASRAELVSELAAAEAGVRTDIATLLDAARGHSGFAAAVASAAGYAQADQARVPLIRERIETICGHA